VLIYRAFPSLPKGDFFTFWLGGRMAWPGSDPYDPAQWLAAHRLYDQPWVPNPAFIYPLPLALLLAPLGLLPLGGAYIAWTALSIGLVMASGWLLLSPGRCAAARPYLIPFLLGAFLFRPLIVILRNGQLGVVLLALLALALWLLERERPFAAGLALALLALKPPLGVTLPALLAAWLLARRAWRGLAGMAAGGAALLLLGMLKDPGWVGKFLAGAGQKLTLTFGYSPTVWGLAGAGCDHAPGCTLAWGGAASIVLAGGLLGIFLWRGARLSAGLALSLAVPAALLVVPYLWAYDQVLLILPLGLAVRGLAQRGRPFLLGALLMLAVSVAALALLVVSDNLQRDHWSALLPVAVLAVGLWQARRVLTARAPGPG
jgi:hypothetical protein